MQQQRDWPGLISAIVPVAGFPNGFVQIDTWTDSTSLRNFELIFVNDSTEYEVQKKLQEIASKLRGHSSVKILTSNSRNPGGSRNIGLANAEGSWIVFWDCDDIPNPSKVIEMIRYAEEEKLDLILGSYQIHSSSSEIIEVKRINEGIKLLESVAINPGLWRFAFKSEIAKETMFPELSMAEDQIFLAKILDKSRNFRYFPEIVYEYWNYPIGQLTKNKEKIRDINMALDYFYNQYKSTKCQPLLIALVRLTVTAIKKTNFLNSLVLIRKFLGFVLSEPSESKKILNAFVLIWTSR